MSKNQLRSSQVVTTFGPGAMVDLPDASVIIAGLDNWRYEAARIPIVEEPRLVGKLRTLLGVEALTLRDASAGSRSRLWFSSGHSCLEIPRVVHCAEPSESQQTLPQTPASAPEQSGWHEVSRLRQEDASRRASAFRSSL